MVNTWMEKFTDTELSTIKEILLSQNLNQDGFDLIDTTKLPCYKKSSDFGYLYVIQNEISNIVKIGKSRNPHQRIKAIKNHAAIYGKTYISEKVANYSNLENKCHKKFKDFSCTSEWFSIGFDEAVKSVEEIVSHELEKFNCNLELSDLIDRYNHEFSIATMVEFVLFGTGLMRCN